MEKMSSKVHVAVTADIRARVDRLSLKQGRRPSDVVRAALAAYLRKEESR